MSVRRVLLCDDHPVFRMGMTEVLEGLWPEALVERVSSLDELRAWVGTHPAPELLILDQMLPDGSGLSILPLPRGWEATRVVVVSAHSDRATVERALEAGASGFVPKTTSVEVLEHALRLVLSGGGYVPPEILEMAGAPSAGGSAALTSRQCEIAELLTRGLTNKEICEVLGISENTVKAHLKAVFRALDVTNRTEAAMAWLASQGTVDP